MRTWKEMLSLRTGALVALCALLIGFYLRQRASQEILVQLQRVADSMRNAESVNSSGDDKPSAPGQKSLPRVAIGLGSCMDVFVRVEDFFKYYNITAEKKDFEHVEDIKTREDLAKIFGFFFMQGAAAERYVRNATLWKELMSVVHGNHGYKMPPGVRWALGGNAPVIGGRLAREGAQVLLGAALSPRGLLHLPSGMQVVSKVADHEEDIHLILEYEVGDRWLDVVAPRANRFILHRDKRNPALRDFSDFVEAIPKFQPDLIVLGGLQLLDGYPFRGTELQDRLARVRKFLQDLGPRVRVHFEMASFSNEKLMQTILTEVIPFVDSLGMNEQELPNLVAALETGTLVRMSDAYPRVATMLDAIRRLWKLTEDSPAVNGRRRLQRVHLHTLGFQAIAVRSGTPWTHTIAASAHAALMAHRHTCGVSQVDVERTKLLMDESYSVSASEPGARRVSFNVSEPVQCWNEELPRSDTREGHVGMRKPLEQRLKVCVAPGLVCTKVVQTAGGGDNISAAGLWPQLLP